MQTPPKDGGSLGLDGEGIFKALHPLFQVFNLPLLLSQQQVFDPVQPMFDLIESFVVVGKPLADHVSHLINGFLNGDLHILFGCR
jgi:hypothetical protein